MAKKPQLMTRFRTVFCHIAKSMNPKMASIRLCIFSTASRSTASFVRILFHESFYAFFIELSTNKLNEYHNDYYILQEEI